MRTLPLPLILARQAVTLVRTARRAYADWSSMPKAEREQTQADAERVLALAGELSILTGKTLAGRRRPAPDADGADARAAVAIMAELRQAVQTLAAGPATTLAAGAFRPRSMRARLAVKTAARVAGRRQDAAAGARSIQKATTESVGMFKRKRQQPVPAVTVPGPRPWPTLDETVAAELASAFDAFYGAETVEATRDPLSRLIDLTGAAVPPHPAERTLWACFDAWTVYADSPAALLATVRIALFTQTYHEEFAPQAGTAVFLLGNATDEQRTAIASRGFEACARLAPELEVRELDNVTVGTLQRHWSTQLGRPIDHVEQAAAEESAQQDEQLEELLDDLRSGDEAVGALAEATRAEVHGRHDAAMPLYARAAELGNVDGMLGAADLALRTGQVSEALYWNEQAARAGSGAGMFNVGLQSLESGRLEQAASWFESAGTAGVAEAYAGLTEVAERAGDLEARKRWAAVGAERGNARCLELHALDLLEGNERDPAVFHHALGLMEDAARQGYAAAMDRCGIFHYHSGNAVQAKYWWEQADRAGDPDARRRLVQYGLSG